MEQFKTFLIVALVAVVAFFGWQIYLDHSKLEQLTEREDNDTIVAIEDLQEEEQEIIEEIPEEPEYVDNGNVYYYLKSGESLDENTKVLMCCFEGDILRFDIFSVLRVSQELMESEYYWDNYLEEKGAKYDYDTSGNGRTVYSVSWDGEPYYQMDQMLPSYDLNSISMPSGRWIVPHYGYHYISVSDDKSTLTKWKVRKDSEEKLDKEYYTRIKKAELMPKGINNDNLYE